MITYSHQLYAALETWLQPFERRVAFREDAGDASTQSRHDGYDVILFGLGRYGRAIGERIAAHGYSILGVDFDPEALREWRQAGFDGCFGDATDPDFPSQLPLRHARAVISAVSRSAGGLTETDPRMALIHGLRSGGYNGHIAVAMHTDSDVEALKALGADIVLAPFVDAAEYAVSTLEQALQADTIRDRD